MRTATTGEEEMAIDDEVPAPEEAAVHESVPPAVPPPTPAEPVEPTALPTPPPTAEGEEMTVCTKCQGLLSLTALEAHIATDHFVPNECITCGLECHDEEELFSHAAAMGHHAIFDMVGVC